MIDPGAQSTARREHRLALAETGRERVVDEEAFHRGGVEEACPDDLAERERRPVQGHVPRAVRGAAHRMQLAVNRCSHPARAVRRRNRDPLPPRRRLGLLRHGQLVEPLG
jgi:hypothetical protein